MMFLQMKTQPVVPPVPTIPRTLEVRYLVTFRGKGDAAFAWHHNATEYVDMLVAQGYGRELFTIESLVP